MSRWWGSNQCSMRIRLWSSRSFISSSHEAKEKTLGRKGGRKEGKGGGEEREGVGREGEGGGGKGRGEGGGGERKEAGEGRGKGGGRGREGRVQLVYRVIWVPVHQLTEGFQS